MRWAVETAGEVAHLDAPAPWALRALQQLGESATGTGAGHPTVRVRAGTGPLPRPTAGRRIGRGAAVERDTVILRSACSSGIDVALTAVGDVVDLTAERRPRARETVLHHVLPRRARLLTADVLLHYPVLWRAGWRGRVPLHAGALVVRGRGVLVVGASGVGKTTLAVAETTAGAEFVSDNLVVSDGESVWGVLEPVRAVGASGPRTTHGRRLTAVTSRRLRTRVDLVVVLRRDGGPAGSRPMDPAEAARELAAGTYCAGELRRYWGFAAALAAGTGRGPVHPAVGTVAQQVCAAGPCVELDVGDRPGTHLRDLIDSLEVAPWT